MSTNITTTHFFTITKQDTPLHLLKPAAIRAALANHKPQSGWLIHKSGRGWYRPNAQGYTSDITQAGRYSYEDARSYSHPNGWDGPRDGITIKHERHLKAQARHD